MTAIIMEIFIQDVQFNVTYIGINIVPRQNEMIINLAIKQIKMIY